MGNRVPLLEETERFVKNLTTVDESSKQRIHYLVVGPQKKRYHSSSFPAHQSQTKYFRKTFRQMYLWPHQLQKKKKKKRMTKSQCNLTLGYSNTAFRRLEGDGGG